MWKMETEPMLIDLSNDFYIVKLYKREEYERALLDGLWMIGNLHVQKWRHNFIENKAEINSLPVWIRFPILPVEYYMEPWLRRAGNSIGRTITVDIAMLLASRGKFARVCVEVDLRRPLMSSYRLRGDFWRLQYEGLHEICFECEKYGHRSKSSPVKEALENAMAPPAGQPSVSIEENFAEAATSRTNSNSRYGNWISVQRNRRRLMKIMKGSMVILHSQSEAVNIGADREENLGDRLEISAVIMQLVGPLARLTT